MCVITRRGEEHNRTRSSVSRSANVTVAGLAVGCVWTARLCAVMWRTGRGSHNGGEDSVVVNSASGSAPLYASQHRAL